MHPVAVISKVMYKELLKLQEQGNVIKSVTLYCKPYSVDRVPEVRPVQKVWVALQDHRVHQDQEDEEEAMDQRDIW